MDITADNIAKAVGGKVERGGSIVCCCPIHEATGTHTPSLVLTITDEKRILFHCRSQNCDAKHFRTICSYVVESAACRDRASAATAEYPGRFATPTTIATEAMSGRRSSTSPTAERNASPARFGMNPRANGQPAGRKTRPCSFIST